VASAVQCTSVFINPHVIHYSLSADIFVLKDELSGTSFPTGSKNRACSKCPAAKFEILPGLLVGDSPAVLRYESLVGLVDPKCEAFRLLYSVGNTALRPRRVEFSTQFLFPKQILFAWLQVSAEM
jgi:hypothetical protein